MDVYDAIIVGGGPAGLTAATYLARFRRRVLVLGAGPSRASWIPESHNTPGFPQGVGGDELLARLVAQATRFGATLRGALVQRLDSAGDGFEIVTPDGRVAAPFVLLATGVLDRMPALEGLDDAIRRSVVRMCPICDAYEAIGQRIAVLSDSPLGDRETAFLRTYSECVTLLRLPSDAVTSAPPSGAAYETLDVALGRLELNDRGVRLTTAGLPDRDFDHLYLALGCTAQSGLALSCGARCDEAGNLVVDAHQQTSVPGLYAAGDVVRGLNQIAVAAGEAAIAATAIHNRLRETT
jgi:thioredoxin reductase (NADPH)